MTVMQDGVEVFVLPDEARCEADNEKRNPLDMDECPWGYEVCEDCDYYSEEWEAAE